MSKYIALPDKPFNLSKIKNLKGGVNDLQQTLQKALSSRRQSLEEEKEGLVAEPVVETKPEPPKQSTSIKDLAKKCAEQGLTQEQCLALRSQKAEESAVTSITSPSQTELPSELPTTVSETSTKEIKTLTSKPMPTIPPPPAPIVELSQLKTPTDCKLQIDLYMTETLNELFNSFDKKDTFNSVLKSIESVKSQIDPISYNQIVDKINNYALQYNKLKERVKNLDNLIKASDWANLIKDIIFTQNEAGSFKCLQWINEKGEKYSRI